MPREIRKPAMTLHKPSRQARVRIDGKDHYLGPWGSDKAQREYDDLMRAWSLQHGQLATYQLTIDDLCIAFLDWAETYYRRPDGTPTGETRNLTEAVRPLIELHGLTLVREFGPLKLKRVRESMIESGMVRTNINRQVHRIRRVFSWGVENELVPPEIHQGLRAVASLRAGRTAAKESEPVKPVPETTVAATLRHLPPAIKAMVKLQLLTGARPGEICAMRPRDVEKLTGAFDGMWCYRPEHHKTAHHGKERRIYIGPQGQDVLRPFLDRAPDAFCFSPADSESLRSKERRSKRRSPVTPSQEARQPATSRRRAPRERYTKDSYARAVARGCKAAKVDAWSPNQLRHSRATVLRERFGIEAAQLVLGHADPGMTLVYAERNFEAAARIMQEIG